MQEQRQNESDPSRKPEIPEDVTVVVDLDAVQRYMDAAIDAQFGPLIEAAEAVCNSYGSVQWFTDWDAANNAMNALAAAIAKAKGGAQ